MAEGTYVKLTKEQTSSQNITPGELHQPIDVIHVCIYSHLMLHTFSYFFTVNVILICNLQSTN